jgi:hypothetical protein
VEFRASASPNLSLGKTKNTEDMAPWPVPGEEEEVHSHRPDNFGQPGYVVEYRGSMLLLTEVVLLAVTLVIILMRVFTRVYILGSVHSDDWWILLATATLIGLTVVHCVGEC